MSDIQVRDADGQTPAGALRGPHATYKRAPRDNLTRITVDLPEELVNRIDRRSAGLGIDADVLISEWLQEAVSKPVHLPRITRA